MNLHQIARAYKIQQTLLKYGLDEFVTHSKLSKYIKLLKWLQPFNQAKFTENKQNKDANSSQQSNRGERLFLAIQELGPVFIKFGQLLSTRKDLLPDDLTEQLALLQDRVAPFDSDEAIELLETSLKGSLTELFAHFETQPLASASVAQVHGATLHDGQQVVVKMLRPGIENIIARDISLLRGLAKIIHFNFPEAKRFRLPEVVDDYQKTIMDELDLRREAANTAKLKRNFEGSADLYVPWVHWPYSHQKIMVMERIYAVPIANLDQLSAAGVNMQRLAEKGVAVFFTQVFRDNFFHADMHPGNIFVNVNDPENPQYIGIDCGIIGKLTLGDQRYLAENFIAFFNRDYQKVAQLHLDSGWVPTTTSVNDFESAIRTVCEPIFGRPLYEISFGQFLVELFQVARRFDMEVQPQLVLLEKTLLYVEGLGRQIYPELDLWKTAKPFLENWLKQRMGVSQLTQEITQQLPAWRERLPEIPKVFFDGLQSLPQINHKLEAINQQIQTQSALSTHKLNVTIWLVFSTLISSITTIVWFHGVPEWIWISLAGVSVVSWIKTLFRH